MNGQPKSKMGSLTCSVVMLAAALLTAPDRASGADTITFDADSIKLENIRLLVTRFDEAFLFYRDVLGLAPTSGAPGENYASFAFAGGGQLAIFRRALMAEAVGAAARPSTRHEQDTAAIVLSVDDVDAMYHRLRDKGVPFVGAPQSREAWGIRAAHFRDPDGNLIEIFSAIRRP